MLVTYNHAVKDPAQFRKGHEAYSTHLSSQVLQSCSTATPDIQDDLFPQATQFRQYTSSSQQHVSYLRHLGRLIPTPSQSCQGPEASTLGLCMWVSSACVTLVAYNQTVTRLDVRRLSTRVSKLSTIHDSLLPFYVWVCRHFCHTFVTDHRSVTRIDFRRACVASVTHNQALTRISPRKRS